ncbi:MAG: hypothetical protein MK194_02040 [Roseibacillus sp.]|nr:hypothetical protein [Roseibacillus sp.]
MGSKKGGGKNYCGELEGLPQGVDWKRRACPGGRECCDEVGSISRDEVVSLDGLQGVG